MKWTPPTCKSFVIVNPTATVKGHSQSNNHSQSNPHLLFPAANLGSLARVIFHIQSPSEQRRFPPPSAINTGLRSEWTPSQLEINAQAWHRKILSRECSQKFRQCISAHLSPERECAAPKAILYLHYPPTCRWNQPLCGPSTEVILRCKMIMVVSLA